MSFNFARLRKQQLVQVRKRVHGQKAEMTFSSKTLGHIVTMTPLKFSTLMPMPMLAPKAYLLSLSKINGDLAKLIKNLEDGIEDTIKSGKGKP